MAKETSHLGFMARMTKEEAIEKAKELYSGYPLESVEDDKEFWIFSFMDHDGVVPPGLPDLCIRKDTGEVFSRIYIPSADRIILSPYSSSKKNHPAN